MTETGPPGVLTAPVPWPVGEVHRSETEPVPTPPLSTWGLIVLETPPHLRAATHTTVQVNILTFRWITKKFKSIIFKETTIFFIDFWFYWLYLWTFRWFAKVFKSILFKDSSAKLFCYISSYEVWYSIWVPVEKVYWNNIISIVDFLWGWSRLISNLRGW